MNKKQMKELLSALNSVALEKGIAMEIHIKIESGF